MLGYSLSFCAYFALEQAVHLVSFDHPAGFDHRLMIGFANAIVLCLDRLDAWAACATSNASVHFLLDR